MSRDDVARRDRAMPGKFALVQALLRVWMAAAIVWITAVVAMHWTMPLEVQQHEEKRPAECGLLDDGACIHRLKAEGKNPSLAFLPRDVRPAAYWEAAARRERYIAVVFIALVPPCGIMVLGFVVAWGVRLFRDRRGS